jgi:polyphosphate kinase
MFRSIFKNRDLSWLSFNKRVLEETRFSDLKVGDKLKFLAIHYSNLEEFSRVRLAIIEELAQSEINEVSDVYIDILASARVENYQQSVLSREILEKQIVPELAANGVILYQNDEEILAPHREEIRHIFMSKVLSYLQPVAITPKARIFLEDRMLYFLVHVNAGRRLEDLKVILNIPHFILPRFYSLSQADGKHYVVYLDDIVRIGIKTLFPDFIFHGIYSIKLNRDADLHLDAQKESDVDEFIEELQKRLSKRKSGLPSRFQYDSCMPAELVNYCKHHLKLEGGEMIPIGRYQGANDFFSFPIPSSLNLNQPSWPSLKHSRLSMFGDYFASIAGQDHLLHFPYQSYDHVLVFFNNAVLDQNVTEIMVTFYRIAEQSHIVNALISAARNGKKVKAFIELKARFDEANNLHWAEQMSKAGVHISYSLPGTKVHAKAALIIRRERGQYRKYGFFGTGNFNEKTAGIYSDMGMLTSDPRLCDELEDVFKYLFHRIQPSPFSHLLVGKFGSAEKFIELIDHEINEAREGRPCGITIKVNNLEERTMINKLYDASRAGVHVNLIVRSICCLRPGIKGLSENIKLYRVVGRYLEHCRIFRFHHSGKDLVYMGSADWMYRNLHHRVEVVFPLYNEQIKQEVKEYLRIQLTPAEKTQCLNEDLVHVPWPENPQLHCVQETFYRLLADNS